uniref:SGNH hydrolase-type esterase domain-containing protein n=1 Tax=Clastoptera arizonana TaxID=38151 RepID=A0A1B6E6I7_9HEMI
MNPCTIPTPSEDLQGDGRWMSQHNRYLEETKDKEPDILFIGDSIMSHLQLRPIWNDLFEPLHALNFGISGDCVQHVLWRLQNGALDNIKPKVVIVHVGTNNITNTSEEISEGIIKVMNTIRERFPDTYIVLTELLPRGQYPNPLREKNAAVNKLLRSRASGLPKVEIVSTDKGLIQQDGTISHHDMPDYLHLSDAGYRKSFEALHELILQLLTDEEEVIITPPNLTPTE